MASKRYYFFYALFLLFLLNGCTDQGRNALISNWDPSKESIFLGQEFWANRLQDWRVKNGRIECLNGKDALRTVHILTHEINDEESGFKIDMKLGVIHDGTLEKDAFAGILIGGGSLDMDYRGRSLIFNRPGKNGGLLAGINGTGELVILDMEKNLEPLAMSDPVPALLDIPGIGLSISASVQPVNDHYIINFTEISTGTNISCEIPGEKLTGNIAMVAHKGGIDDTGSFWFKDLSLSGSKLSIDPHRSLGPIVSAMHTLSRQILKMSVQMMPVGSSQPKDIFLKIKPEEADIWETEVKSLINKDGYIAEFKIEDWDDSRSYNYQVEYKYSSNQGLSTTATYEGIIRKNPIDKEEFCL
jgi:alkaline phosphatase D